MLTVINKFCLLLLNTMAKRILDEHMWSPYKSMMNLKIKYIHRGVKGNVKVICGKDIKYLEKSFFVIEVEGKEVRIPYHRILEIWEGDRIIWKKRSIKL